jgi:hypothetical protein
LEEGFALLELGFELGDLVGSHRDGGGRGRVSEFLGFLEGWVGSAGALIP